MTDSQTLGLLSMMAQDVCGEVSGGIEPLDLPLMVPLDQASEVLDLDVGEGRRLLKAGTYPVAVTDLGNGPRVRLTALVRSAGLLRVQAVLGPDGAAG